MVIQQQQHLLKLNSDGKLLRRLRSGLAGCASWVVKVLGLSLDCVLSICIKTRFHVDTDWAMGRQSICKSAFPSERNDSWIWIWKSNQQNIYDLTFFLHSRYPSLAFCNIFCGCRHDSQRFDGKISYFLISRKKEEKRWAISPQWRQRKWYSYPEQFFSDFMIKIYVFLLLFNRNNSKNCFYSFLMKRRQ